MFCCWVGGTDIIADVLRIVKNETDNYDTTENEIL